MTTVMTSGRLITEQFLKQIEVFSRRERPSMDSGPLEVWLRCLKAPRRVIGQGVNRIRPVRLTPFGNDYSRVTDNIRNFPAVARDNENAARKRLDEHPTELLAPSWRRLTVRAKNVQIGKNLAMTNTCYHFNPYRQSAGPTCAGFSIRPAPANGARHSEDKSSRALINKERPFSSANRPKNLMI
jgi:hypothetical protein